MRPSDQSVPKVHSRQRRLGSKGFTIAEMMVVIAIIVILLAVAGVTIISNQRSMTKLQYDSNAREIFISAQNHLAMAETQNYLGLEGVSDAFGYAETKITGQDDTGSGNNYFVVNATGFTRIDSGENLLKYMLPFGAVDDTVRKGGCYIIRYHKASATVLDVFYWQEGDGRFDYNDFEISDYALFMAARGESGRATLKSYSRNGSGKRAVIGYYGGAEAGTLITGAAITSPEISVVNAERLYVTLKDRNPQDQVLTEGYVLKLIITGKTSKVSREITLINNGSPADLSPYKNVSADVMNGSYTVVLDDITSPERLHFADLFCSGGEKMIPGEDLSIRAVAYNNKRLTNVAYSPAMEANSLFGNASRVTGSESSATADISNIRHLENLSTEISAVNDDPAVTYTAAEQGCDLSWTDFKSRLGNNNLSVYVWGLSGYHSPDGCYLPVYPPTALAYRGGGNTISSLRINAAGSAAGMFAVLNGGSVSDLELSNIAVTSGLNSGALAGVVSGSTVTNVLAVNSLNSNALASQIMINGSESSGGLIGTVLSGDIRKCAASVLVKSSGGDAGGLIGRIAGSASVTGCYSGGRTADAKYTQAKVNVEGAGTAGGLIGSAGTAAVQYCYSTCSVSSGAIAGGFVGSAGGDLTRCYAAGAVYGDGAKGAFAGSFTGEAEFCNYYEIINEYSYNTASDTDYGYLGAVDHGSAANISAFDANAASYNTFVMDPSYRAFASPFDAALNRYYHGKYNLRTVKQLGADAALGENFIKESDFVYTHYGDWPAPETWTIND